MESAAPMTFLPGGKGRVVAIAAGVPLLLIGLALLVTGTVWAVVLLLVPLWALTTFRQRAVLTDTDVTVQGRFTRRQVELAQVEQVHEDRTRVVWLSAPAADTAFRVYFIPPSRSGKILDGETFVTEVRRRAAAQGAQVDAGAELVATPPRGTAPLFSL